MQLLGLILFYLVFIQLFIALSFYLWRVIYGFIKEGRAKKPEKPTTEVESDNVRLHISEGLIQVNRLPNEEQDE